MAQTRRKRTRKHRGNAAGIVERPAHNSRGTTVASGKGRSTKEQTRLDARQRRQERMNRPPTWKGATQRAGVAAGLFAVLIMIFFKENIATSITLALFMLVVYIPLSYMTDNAIYRWRVKKGVVPPSKPG
jgi:Flp pilus assembly protein TadB